MRGFAGLLAYLVGLSAIISIGVVGLMALQSDMTERHPHQSLRRHKKSVSQSQSSKR